MIRVSVVCQPLQLQCTVADYPADSAPSEEEMDIDAFDVPVKGKQKSYHVDFTTLSKTDVDRAMNENVEYITGIFGIEVRELYGHSGARVSLIGTCSPKWLPFSCDITSGTRKSSLKNTWITQPASTPRLVFLPNLHLPDRPRLALLGRPDEPLRRLRNQKSRSPSRDLSFVRFALMTPKRGHLLFLVPTSSVRNAGVHTRRTRSGPRENLRSPAWLKIAL